MRLYASWIENMEFQSAVAHELISNFIMEETHDLEIYSFKALSRMSSFPTNGYESIAG